MNTLTTFLARLLLVTFLVTAAPVAKAQESVFDIGYSFLEGVAISVYEFFEGFSEEVIEVVGEVIDVVVPDAPVVVVTETITTTEITERIVTESTQYVTRPVTETLYVDGVTEADLEERLLDFRNSVTRSIVRMIRNDPPASGGTDVSTASVEDLLDVSAMTKSFGDLLAWNGTAWTNIATSTLNVVSGTSTPPVWGDITGTLADQTDLQTAIDAKLSLSDWYATTTDALDEGSTNQYFTLSRFATALAGTTTDAVAQGSTNRYYTDALARNAISETITGLDYATSTGEFSGVGGYVIPTTASSTQWDTAFSWGNHALAGYITDGNTLWDNIYNLFDKDTDDTDDLLAGITNLFYADGLVQTYLDTLDKSYFFSTASANGWFATKTTDDLLDGGGNQYVTDARTRSAFSAGTGLTYATSTGAFALDATGNWTGTFDALEGTSYLARANQTGTQLASTISDFAATARGLFSSALTGIGYDSGTGVFSLTAGYAIPLTASTTAWNSFYDAPSTRITAGTNLQWTGNTLSFITSPSGGDAFTQGGNSFATTTVLGTLDNNALQFSTNALARMSILSNGNVGIGTTSPIAKFAIDSTSLTGSNVFSITSGSAGATGASTWTNRSASEASAWLAVTYGNGLYVAVAQLGTNRVMTSPDGITWTSRTTPVVNTWQSITYGNGLFVAVSSDGTNQVMTSPDGITWTARVAASVSGWKAITYGNGLFVAVAQSGASLVMTSSDGITWTSRTAAEANSWQSVTYGNGLFVAVSSGGTNRVMTSPDSITWTARTAAEANSWQSVTYGNGLFVAVSSGGTNRVMTSPDSITWTARTAAEANQWRAVIYGNGLFVALSDTGTNRVMTSLDGITWTARTAAQANTWYSVAYGNGLFVAVAQSGTNRVMTSPITYVTSTLANVDNLGNLSLGTTTAYARLSIDTENLGSSAAFLVGTNALPKLVVSNDGNVGIGKLTPTMALDVVGQSGTVSGASTWTARTAAEANSWSSVTYGNGLFVAVANFGTNRVMTSPDGITWTARSAAQANSWSSVTYGNGLFVAVSYDGTNRVMTSPDGITWTARTAAEANQWYGVTYGNGLYVAVAGSGTNQVMTSPDGITWTARAASQANTWSSVTYGNGLFAAVAITGTNRVMTSPDGITWTNRTAAEATTWRAVTYGNGLFVAVADAGTNRVMTSPNGITWTGRTAAQANTWYSVAYGNGLFVATAQSGSSLVMTSPDGITWTARTAAQANLWTSVTYGNGLFVSVAGSGTNRVMTSPISAPAVARFANTTGENCTINPALTSLSCSSDERLKKNIVALGSSTDSLAKLSSLSAVLYNWNSEEDSHTLHAGFLAQSVQQILPDLVTEDGNGYLALNYAGFAPYLVSGIQQLNERTSFITSSTTASSTITLTTTGQGIGIGTNTITHMLTVAGDASFAGSVFAESFVVPTDDTNLPSEVLTAGGVDLYQMGTYALQRVTEETLRVDVILEKLVLIEGAIAHSKEDGKLSLDIDSTELMASLASEPLRIVSEFIESAITDGLRPFADFVAVRVTAIKAYFTEVHTEEFCFTGEEGSTTCVTGEQLDELILLLPEAYEPLTPPVVETPPTPASEEGTPEPEATPLFEAPPEAISEPVIPATEPEPVPAPEEAGIEEPAPEPVAEDPEPAPETVPTPAL